METIILISSIVFWVIFYILQGMHDVRIVEEIQLLKKNSNNEKLSLIENEIVSKEISWKLWGSLEKALTKLTITIIIYFFSHDLYFSLLCLALSVGLRWLVHDLTVAIGLGRGLSHIGPDFIWTDKILAQLKRVGINQYVIKLTINFTILTMILMHLYF
jgi:hypothetical protein